MKKPLNIISFLLIIFLGSSTSMGADFPPVKTGTMLVCKNNLPHTYLIEFKDKLKYEIHHPLVTKESIQGKYYRLGTWENTYSFDNDLISVFVRRNVGTLGYYKIQIDRSNLRYKNIDIKNDESNCELVDKTTFDNEIEKLKKEIEEHNNLIDEHYKKTNKI